MGEHQINVQVMLSGCRPIPHLRKLYSALLLFVLLVVADTSGFSQSDRISLEKRIRNHPQEVLDQVLAGKVYEDMQAGEGGRELIIGQCFWRLGNFDQAHQAFIHALDIAQHEKDSLLLMESWRGLASVSWRHGDLDQALDYQLTSFTYIPRESPPIHVSRSYLWMGIIHADLKLYEDAINYYRQGIYQAEQISDSLSLGQLWNMVGRAYRKQKVYDSARWAHQISFLCFDAVQDSLGVSDYLNNMGSIFRREGRYDSAIQYFEGALEIQAALHDVEGLADGYNDLGTTYSQLGNSAKAFEYLNKALEVARSARLRDDIRYAYASLAANYDSIGQYRDALRFYRLESELADSLFQEEVTRRRDLLTMVSKNEQNENQIRLLKLAEEEQKERSRIQIQITVVIIALVLLGLGLMWWQTRMQKKQAKELAYKNRQIHREKTKSEELLLNILPREVASEIMSNGKYQPVELAHVTVMFVDFVGFSSYSKGRKPKEIVHDLSVCFEAFDKIIDRHGLEKIKTIGDAYMCAGGVPKQEEGHELRVVRAALDIQDFMEGWVLKHRLREEPCFEARIGIHSGPVVAGVVGLKKFTYDIWGDTVNVASRMESSGKPGRVNISEATYQLVRPYFICRPRGKVKAKNIGEVQMYFVDWAV